MNYTSEINSSILTSNQIGVPRDWLSFIIIILNFILTIHQSVKQRHFSSSCCGCLKMEYDSERENKENKQ